MAKRSRPAKRSAHTPERPHLGPPHALAFLLAERIAMEDQYTAAITGIGSAAKVHESEIASLTFIVVATGAKPGQPLVPGIEIESPLGERKFLEFGPGKLLPSRNHITDWTITIHLFPVIPGVHRARLYLNGLQRSEMAFRIHVTSESGSL